MRRAQQGRPDQIHQTTKEHNMTYTKLTRTQHMVAMDFVATARANGISNISMVLPTGHELIRTNKVAQIRKATDAIAQGWDELGNRVRLTPDLRVLQD
jgi:hypothetical protein